MITVRLSADRGHFDHGWLDTRHTFSFGDYHDPERMGFSALRVINQDIVQPGRGFGTHGHRDMEIVSYVLSGALEHRDSMENGSTIRPGEVQLMSAGTGVTHSEFNPSPDETAEFLQIWILPRETGTAPRYEQRAFAPEQLDGGLRLVVSPDGREDSLRIAQLAEMRAGSLRAGSETTLEFGGGRCGWVQVVSGRIRLDRTQLSAGDGAAISRESRVPLRAESDTELLAFDLPEENHE